MIPPEERDPELARKLEAELPGILNWALDGFQAWRKRKLAPPPSVVEAVDEYRAEMDVLGQWLADPCEDGPDFEVGASDAYYSYQMGCVANGIRPWTSAGFGRALKERFDRKRTAHGAR